MTDTEEDDTSDDEIETDDKEVDDLDMKDFIDKVMHQDPATTTVELYYLWKPTARQSLRLVNALKQNQHVKKLILKSHQPPWLTPERCVELAALFRENDVIEHVILPMRIGNDAVATILEGLHENTSVHTLDLSECGMTGHEGGRIIQILLLQNQSITTLNLSNNWMIGNGALIAIAQALRSNSCVLTSLSLDYCQIDTEGIRFLCDALQHNSKLNELYVCGN